MNEKIVKYINQLFESIELNDQLIETKEELTINLNEKYNDLISEGFSEDVAYRRVIAGIGDVDELINMSSNINRVNQSVEISINTSSSDNMKRGIAIFLFITSIVPIIIFSEFASKYAVIGLVLMLIMVGLGVVMLISINKPEVAEVSKKTAEVVEPQDKRIKKAVHSIIWIATTLLFFVLTFNGFGMGWMIFIIGYLFTQLADLIVYLNNLNAIEQRGEVVSQEAHLNTIKKFVNTIIWTLAVIAFFVIDEYRYSWLIFFVAAGITQIVSLVFVIKESK